MNYKSVKSSFEISKSIAYYLEMSAPQLYPSNRHATLVKEMNDVLQGRSKDGTTIIHVMDELEKKGGTYYAGEIDKLSDDIEDFLLQKSLMHEPYEKSSNKEYKYRLYGTGPDALKIINQRIYDSAVKNGFPPNFFTRSYFDGVNIYCMPDSVNATSSKFNNCKFTACRALDVYFSDSTFTSTEFNTVNLYKARFSEAALYHTHFNDCELSDASFCKARLKSCNMIDCGMNGVQFYNAHLDGCSMGRITAEFVRGIANATITMGGATHQECQNNRESIYKALGTRPADPEANTPKREYNQQGKSQEDR